jgi:hypothetical protein
MWQVYLYLANEHQASERKERARERQWRWPSIRRSRNATQRPRGTGPRTTPTPADRVH